MPYQYKVYGPFVLRRNGQGYLDFSAPFRKRFWSGVSDAMEGLSTACGCYVFRIGTKPWYVGLASAQTFRNECLSPTKKAAYLEADNQADHYGTASLILLAKRTPGGSFANPSQHPQKDITLLEELLIGQALRRNSGLINVAKTALLKNMRVPGLINTGPGEGAALAVQALRRTMGT
ncbi:hypothetical protein [Acidiferrobacter sp.]